MPIRHLTIALLFGLRISALAAPATAPNILLILADDLGYGDVGCYNPDSKIPTPHLDRLATQGMRFTDAHSPSTVCTPTRYSLMTGRMAFRTGFKGVFTGVGGPCMIEEDRLTLPGMLKQQGYATAMFGKWHIGMSQYIIPENDPDAPGQLYNLASDPGEKSNLYSKNPEKVAELKAILEASKKSGRSAPVR